MPDMSTRKDQLRISGIFLKILLIAVSYGFIISSTIDLLIDFQKSLLLNTPTA